jgi:4-hydroxy-3-polyprenylbenzoate decarboxylase
MGLDGTIKSRSLDGFQRDWPNIIVASDSTIETVDKKWNSLISANSFHRHHFDIKK